ncbi:MAG: hypothetical protein JNL48_08350 [Acidobacteria bacterium]|nr:hypothetical protein [Acidobacteriota bacterium]
MQAQMARRWFTLAMVALVMTAVAAGRAQTVDVTGDWLFSVETGMGSGSPAISFKQDGEKLTGTYNGQLGSANFTGTVKGTAIQFSFTLDAQGQQVDVNYTGTVDGTSMKGAVAMAGGQLSGTFTGTKK